MVWLMQPMNGMRSTMIWMTGLFALTVGTQACTEMFFGSEDDDEFLPARVPVLPPECEADRDCVLMPAKVTCCGECEPVPPFEAATRATLDWLRADTAAHCAPERLCDSPPCAEAPVGCEARAVCRNGRCVVHETGCGLRVAD